MDINSLFGFDRGANKEAAEYARQNDGQISINPWQRLFGAEDKDVQNILDTDQRKALNRELGGAAALVGRSGALNGETRTQMQGRIAAGQRQMKANEEGKQRGYRQEDAATALNQTLAVGRQGIEAADSRFATQLKSQENQFAHTSEMARLDRGLERELSSNNQTMQLALGTMNADLADKRMDYDRETRSMDKRDRMIATLMSRLGSLGGAFSL